MTKLDKFIHKMQEIDKEVEGLEKKKHLEITEHFKTPNPFWVNKVTNQIDCKESHAISKQNLENIRLWLNEILGDK